jgi:hypothetical protein
MKAMSDAANYLALSASDKLTPLTNQVATISNLVAGFPSRTSRNTVYYHNWFSTMTSQRTSPPWISTDNFLVRWSAVRAPLGPPRVCMLGPRLGGGCVGGGGLGWVRGGGGWGGCEGGGGCWASECSCICPDCVVFVA